MKRTSREEVGWRQRRARFSGASGFAQSGSTDESKRKVKNQDAPQYPGTRNNE